ncbi:MAG: nuclear transport factor 2 family protein [Olsenella sp.]|nr:nuclear transport factor 2 family protein [Olsenella sp.]
MTNKEIVLRFYDEVFNGWDLDRIDAYVRENYVQHNPTVKDGREGFREFMQFFTGMKPRCEVIRCDEVGDMVYVFFRCTLENGVVNKVMDMYRLEDGMLAEHWDVVEHDVAEKIAGAVNDNGIF